MRQVFATWGRLLLVLLLPLAACGAEGPDESAGIDRRGSDEPVAPDEQGARVEEMVELELPDRAGPGETVPIVVRLRNREAEAVDLGLTGDPVAWDVIVRDSTGTVVWSRLHSQVVGLVLRLRRLEPGEALEFRDEWNLQDNEGRPLAPGTYRVTGIVPTDDGDLSSEQEALVVER